MGTYTTNYNLFLPSIGEQGWGDLVNGNFTTIDTVMKGLSNNIGTLETEINAVEERVTILEAGEFESISAGTIIADTIKGDITACFNAVSLTSNEIGLVSFSSSKTLASANHNANGAWGYGTSTYTYRANPFVNIVTFTISALSGATGYLKLNGVTLLSGTGTVNNVTLSDGDTIVVNLSKTNSSGGGNNISMSWNCYLVNT